MQLEWQIKHLILAGRFEVGSRLPSIRALAGYLRVNRNTVARVISDLEREGYVKSRRGSGVYVDEQTDKVLENLKRVDAVVCTSITARKLRELGASGDLEIIEEDRTLDQSGIEMLGRMLRERQPNAAG